MIRIVEFPGAIKFYLCICNLELSGVQNPGIKLIDYRKFI
jgi:hypothetical protein